ncbi:MAG: hypothetical protein HQL76_05690 [Magnetococcales bacterium]|nr:hypothetical protein [Magnetococcales bacterium]
MIPVHLAIDEVRMTWAGGSGPDVTQSLESFSRLFDRARKDGCILWKDKAIYETMVVPGMRMVDVLFTAESPLDRDLQNALMIQLDRCRALEDLDEPARPTVARMAVWRSRKEAAGCLFLLGNDSDSPWDVTDEQSLMTCYRAVPELVDCPEDEFIEHAARSFPQLAFKPGLAREFDRFDEPYRILRHKVGTALAILNDQGRRIRLEHSDEALVKVLSAAIGFPTTRESPQTHGNRKAMDERKTSFGGRTFFCEWHVKFRPNIDRMYFHFGFPDVADGRILICHFTRHFRT